MLISVNIKAAANAENLLLNPSDKAGKYALLIGIKDYPYLKKKLKGCLNDVEIMQSLLITKFTFPKDNIICLTNEKATREGILSSFRQLIATTRPNDTILIYYSGHGSQMRDSLEVDGYDETIIPFDYGKVSNGIMPITDKLINKILRKLSAKTGNITVILDCCHAGGGTKELITGSEKEIPADYRQGSSELPGIDLGDKDTQLKNDEANYILLAGCTSGQKSHEFKAPNGTIHGIMTAALVEKLLQSKTPLTWTEVVEDIRMYIGQFYNQTPELVGLNKNSYVFGERYVDNEAYFTVNKKKDSIFLDGGKIHGVTIGSIYKVYLPGTLVFSDSIGLIQVTAVSDLTAEVKLLSGKIAGPNCRAVESKFLPEEKAKVYVSFLGSWTNEGLIIKKNITELNSVEEDNIYPNIIYKIRGNYITVHLGRDTITAVETYDLNKSETIAQLRSSILRWVKWFRVANIRNPHSALKVSLSMISAREINLDKPDYFFKEGEKVSFKITNSSFVPVYVYIIDMVDNGKIDVYNLATFTGQIYSGSEAIPPGKAVDCEMMAEVTKGSSRTRDLLKIFATTHPVNLTGFQQNMLGESKEIEMQKTLMFPKKELNNITDWATIEKIISTSLP